MSTYPAYSEVPYAVFKDGLQFKTLISNFDDLGQEKRRRKWLYHKRSVSLAYNNISKIDATILWNFYAARSGSYDSFSFYYKDVNDYTGEYVGTADGSLTTWSLPGKNTAGRSVKLNDITQSEGTSASDYYVNADSGTDGSDQIVFNTVPNTGQRITLDFTGILRVNCRFQEDNLSFQEFFKQLRSLGISLQGLLVDE